MKSHIPISSNPENWWQKSRIFYLKHFLKNIEKKDDFNILEIGPGFGLNVNTLSQFGKVDIAETETHFLKYLKDKKSDQIRNFFDERHLHFKKIKKIIIQMESIKPPKRIIKKQLKNVNKAIIEIAEMKFKNIEEKEEKLDALVFLKNQILRKAEKLEI